MTKHEVEQTVSRFWKYGYCTPNRQTKAFASILFNKLFKKAEAEILDDVLTKKKLHFSKEITFVYNNNIEKFIINVEPLYPTSSTPHIKNLHYSLNTFIRNVLKEKKFLDISKEKILKNAMMQKEKYQCNFLLMRYLTTKYLGVESGYISKNNYF